MILYMKVIQTDVRACSTEHYKCLKENKKRRWKGEMKERWEGERKMGREGVIECRKHFYLSKVMNLQVFGAFAFDVLSVSTPPNPHHLSDEESESES